MRSGWRSRLAPRFGPCAYFGWFAFRHPDHIAAFPLDVHAPSFIYVDADGRRFADETGWEVHDNVRSLTAYLPRRRNYPHMPGHLVFRREGASRGAVERHRQPDEFGRARETVVALEPPLYALKMHAGVATASGGPRRDERARVLRPGGEPIPGLSAAGAAGAVWGHLTEHGGGLTDAIAFGRIAGVLG